MAARATAHEVTQDARVVTKATVRAAALLDMPNNILGRVLGLSDATITRMKSGAYHLRPGAKPFEIAVLFLRLYRSLDGIIGGDDVIARRWLQSENIALGGTPIERIQTLAGLTDVIAYLDARRAIV